MGRGIKGEGFRSLAGLQIGSSLFPPESSAVCATLKRMGKSRKRLHPRNVKPILLITLGLALKLSPLAVLQSDAADTNNAQAQALPGRGLAQHDFLYAGEAKNRRAFIIRNGQIV